MNKVFEDIRPYHDEELPEVYEELIADEAFRGAVNAVLPNLPFEMVAQKMRGCKTKEEFQRTFCYDLIMDIVKKCTKGVTLDHSALNGEGKAYTYISNHRDIILDSGFLSVLLVDIGLNTVEIAIGDNLLIYPWIKKLVRINKSFIVKRGLPMRQMLESSVNMSGYMHFTIKDKKQSIWIAQREGRAKDADDRTQDSVLKMLAMGGDGNIIDSLKEMNIAPLAISYEYDPCDYLKAKEFQLKRDNPAYKKQVADDLENMKTGLFGYKGHVHFCVAPCINDKLDLLDEMMPKNELFTQVSSIINKEIHRNYRIYPNNYIALDMLEKTEKYMEKYSPAEKEIFENYLRQQIDKIDLLDKDMEFLKEKMLQMYANPLRNYLLAL